MEEEQEEEEEEECEKGLEEQQDSWHWSPCPLISVKTNTLRIIWN